jgi:hypothetical protein
MIPYFKRRDLSVELNGGYGAIAVDQCSSTFTALEIEDPCDRSEVGFKWPAIVRELRYMSGARHFSDLFFARAHQLHQDGEPLHNPDDERFYITFKLE